jgi:hypothetical protein
VCVLVRAQVQGLISDEPSVDEIVRRVMAQAHAVHRTNQVRQIGGRASSFLRTKAKHWYSCFNYQNNGTQA